MLSTRCLRTSKCSHPMSRAWSEWTVDATVKLGGISQERHGHEARGQWAGTSGERQCLEEAPLRDAFLSCRPFYRTDAASRPSAPQERPTLARLALRREAESEPRGELTARAAYRLRFPKLPRQLADFHFPPPGSPRGTRMLTGTLAGDSGSF